MGIRDWFKREPKDNHKEFDGSWTFSSGNKTVSIRNFTDTGVEYPDIYDNNVMMKLYTFTMRKAETDSIGKAGVLDKLYETVAFEAPASWDIEDAINKGMLTSILNQTNAINKSYNDERQIDVLGRFDANSRFTLSAPGIQEYIDKTYVPALNERIEKQRITDEKNRKKESDPGFLIKAIGKVLDFFDGIKAKKEMKLFQAAQESQPHIDVKPSRTELGLSSHEIRHAGREGFYIGNSNDKNVMAINIFGEAQMLQDGSYLYTAKKQLIRTFNSAADLTCIPNCQFSLPVPPENFAEFLNGCENPANPYARSNADALMLLLNQDPLPGRGLYIGGLALGKDGNLQYIQGQNLQNSINYINGINDQRNLQFNQQPTNEYEI